jgi:hypothetical protein
MHGIRRWDFICRLITILYWRIGSPMDHFCCSRHRPPSALSLFPILLVIIYNQSSSHQTAALRRECLLVWKLLVCLPTPASRSRLMTERDRLLFAPLPSLYLRAVETESEIKTQGEEYRSWNSFDLVTVVSTFYALCESRRFITCSEELATRHRS